MSDKPLRVRDGARFSCHGDGLCCADVHTFGPLDDQETAMLEAMHDGLVDITEEGDRVITPKDDGTCMFLSTEGLCELHLQLGEAAKPASCKQFPFVLIETPTHLRGVTEHRCPCRTMGERAPITLDHVRATCPGAPDRTLLTTIARDPETEITIDEYEALEAPVLEALARGEDPLEVLGAPQIPKTAAKTLGLKYVREAGDSRFAHALDRFGRALLREVGLEVDGPVPELPWAASFDRAEARSEPGDPAAILADWVADYVWSLEHAFLGSWEDTRVELALRVRVARRIAAEREAEGARPDRAMAEAVAIVELAGIDDDYRAFVGRAAG